MAQEPEVLDARVVRIAAAQERAVRDDLERARIDDDALRMRDGREAIIDLAAREQHDPLVVQHGAGVVDAAVAAGQVAARDQAPARDAAR